MAAASRGEQMNEHSRVDESPKTADEHGKARDEAIALPPSSSSSPSSVAAAVVMAAPAGGGEGK